MLANPDAFEKGPEVLYSGHFWGPGGRRRRIERADQMECGEGEAELCAMSPSVTLQNPWTLSCNFFFGCTGSEFLIWA